MARKNTETTVKVISVYDGDQAAKDVFVGLIADHYHIAKSQDSLAKPIRTSYNDDEVPELRNLSGLAG